MPVNLRLDIPRDARAPGRARAALEELNGFPEGQLAPTKLLVSELITNSVKYGADGPVRLVVRGEDSGRTRIEVIDRGVGFIPTARDRPATEVGGWGLHMVEALADRWGVYEGSTHVWFEMGAR